MLSLFKISPRVKILAVDSVGPVFSAVVIWLRKVRVTLCHTFDTFASMLAKVHKSPFIAAKIEEKCLIVQASVWARSESLESTCSEITLADAFCFSAKPRECLLNS